MVAMSSLPPSSPRRTGARSWAAVSIFACALAFALTSLTTTLLRHQTAQSAPASAPSAPAPASAQARDLGHDEALGGHTLSRHVGRSDQELRDRLRKDRHISAASTYSDRATAERVVGEALRRSERRLRDWLDRSGPRPNLVLDYRGDPAHPIGRSLGRGEEGVRPVWDAVVVLKWRPDGDYFVLTSYPEASR
jgi:toxin YxiD